MTPEQIRADIGACSTRNPIDSPEFADEISELLAARFASVTADMAQRLSRAEAENRLHRTADIRQPFCPDHRDKVVGLTCRECAIETLTRQLGAASVVKEISSNPH